MYRELEDVSGKLEIRIKKGENAASKYQEFLDNVRQQFRKKGKSIKSIQTESIESKDKKIVFSYKAQVYDYDFEEEKRYWDEYEIMLKRGSYEL